MGVRTYTEGLARGCIDVFDPAATHNCNGLTDEGARSGEGRGVEIDEDDATLLLAVLLGVRGGLRRAPSACTSARALNTRRPTRTTHSAACNVGRMDRACVCCKDLPYLCPGERASIFPESRAL
jgi:hypothetical protein